MTGHEQCGSRNNLPQVGDLVDFAGQPGYIAGTVSEILTNGSDYPGDWDVIVTGPGRSGRPMRFDLYQPHRHNYMCDCD